eukprot:15200187-Ditylum_brightwellii.AAC.1
MPQSQGTNTQPQVNNATVGIGTRQDDHTNYSGSALLRQSNLSQRLCYLGWNDDILALVEK